MRQFSHNSSQPLIRQLTLVSFTALLYSTTPAIAQSPLPTLAPSAPSTSPAPALDTEGYQLGPGDRVRLDIFEVPEYSGELQVLSDGSLNLPLVGAVSVRGMTIKQASTVISSKLAPVIKRPLVTLTLLAARPIKLAIAGEVSRPGSYTVSPTAPEGIPTVTRALQLAGGISQSADTRQIQVRRARSQNQGADQIFTVDLWQLLQAGDIRQDMLLQDGDTVFVPTASAVNIAEANQLAASSFAASQLEPLKIAIVGEVNRPGPYTITGKAGEATAGIETPTSSIELPTVTQAIQVAGGITQSADIRKIEIRRPTKTGTNQVIAVDLWKLLQEGDLQQDVPLQAGDTIAIPTATALSADEATELASASFSPNKIAVNVVGEVERPGTVEIPPNTPLNQGLLAAGGFNRRARKGSVELIRLNPNGTVAKRQISIDFAKGLNESNNPPLRNNDTIVVRRSGAAGLSDALGTILSPLTGGLSVLRIFGL